jgi:small redox-active disulfide protein 2
MPISIEILGTGCAKCNALEQAAHQAVNDLGIDAQIVKIDAMDQIIARGVMMTPAIVVNGEVKSSGRVLSSDEIQAFLR